MQDYQSARNLMALIVVQKHGGPFERPGNSHSLRLGAGPGVKPPGRLTPGMPASYAIDKQRKLVITRAWGNCTAEDALEFRRKILADEDFDPTFAQLADFTGVTGIDITPGEVRMLAWVTPFSPDSRRAIVAENPVAFGFSRIYETLRGLRGDRHIRVFRNREEALAWIFAKDLAA